MGLLKTKNPCKGLQESAESYKPNERGEDQYEAIRRGFREEAEAKTKKHKKLAEKERLEEELRKVQEEVNAREEQYHSGEHATHVCGASPGTGKKSRDSLEDDYEPARYFSRKDDRLKGNVARDAYKRGRGDPAVIIRPQGGSCSGNIDDIAEETRKKLEEASAADLEDKVRRVKMDIDGDFEESNSQHDSSYHIDKERSVTTKDIAEDEEARKKLEELIKKANENPSPTRKWFPFPYRPDFDPEK